MNVILIGVVVVFMILYMINRKYTTYHLHKNINEGSALLKKNIVEANILNPASGTVVRRILEIDNDIFPFGGVHHKKGVYRISPDCGTPLKGGMMKYEWVFGYADPIDIAHPKIVENEKALAVYMKPVVYVVPVYREKSDGKKAFMSPHFEFEKLRVCPATPISDKSLAEGYNTHMFVEYNRAGEEDDWKTWVMLAGAVVGGIGAVVILSQLNEIKELIMNLPIP